MNVIIEQRIVAVACLSDIRGFSKMEIYFYCNVNRFCPGWLLVMELLKKTKQKNKPQPVSEFQCLASVTEKKVTISDFADRRLRRHL